MLLKIAFVYFYAAALMVLATALPTARQSTHEYDTYQDKLSALLNEYEVGGCFHSTVTTHSRSEQERGK